MSSGKVRVPPFWVWSARGGTLGATFTTHQFLRAMAFERSQTQKAIEAVSAVTGDIFKGYSGFVPVALHADPDVLKSFAKLKEVFVQSAGDLAHEETRTAFLATVRALRAQVTGVEPDKIDDDTMEAIEILLLGQAVRAE